MVINNRPASEYDTFMLISKEELAANVELVFVQAEEGLTQWQKNWREEEILDRIISKFEKIKELFVVVSERADEFTIEETNRYNKKFYDLYNSIVNKGNEFRVLVPWPRRNFGM